MMSYMSYILWHHLHPKNAVAIERRSAQAGEVRRKGRPQGAGRNPDGAPWQRFTQQETYGSSRKFPVDELCSLLFFLNLTFGYLLIASCCFLET